MTIDLPNPTSSHAPAVPAGPDAGARAADIAYRGMSIRMVVAPTPDCVYGQADLLENDQFRGRLALGSPRATPEEIQQRLSLLARARVDVWRTLESQSSP